MTTDHRDALAAVHAGLFAHRTLRTLGPMPPMIFSAYRDGEVVVQAIPPLFRDDADERRCAFRFALLAVAHRADAAGVTANAAVKRAPVATGDLREDLGPDWVRPDEDPAAEKALVVLMVGVGFAVSAMQRYSVDDVGLPSFEEVEVEWDPRPLLGPTAEALESVARAARSGERLAAHALGPKVLATVLESEGFTISTP